MKIFHISDLHRGLRLYGLSLIDDPKHILNHILEKIDEHQPDVLAVAGDTYDKPVPPIEAIEFFDNFLVELSKRADPFLIKAIG